MCALRKQYSGTPHTLRSLEGRLRNENNTLVSISVLSHFECANWLFTREEPQHYTTEKDWVIPRSRAQDFRRHDCRSWEGCLSQVDVLTHPLSCFFPNTRFCAPFPDISWRCHHQNRRASSWRESGSTSSLGNVNLNWFLWHYWFLWHHWFLWHQ